MKTWEECLPYVEFAPFEIVYGFNPLTLLDLTPLPMDGRINFDENKKADFVSHIHEKAKQNIEKRIEQYANQANKGSKKVVFEPRDGVWLHMRKKWFSIQRHSELLPRGDRPFQLIEMIND